MKKKTTSHKKTAAKHSSSVKKQSRSSNADGQYIILVRSWVFLVLFALMLGIGVIVGNYINGQLNGYPTVAGYSTEQY